MYNEQQNSVKSHGSHYNTTQAKPHLVKQLLVLGASPAYGGCTRGHKLSEAAPFLTIPSS